MLKLLIEFSLEIAEVIVGNAPTLFKVCIRMTSNRRFWGFKVTKHMYEEIGNSKFYIVNGTCGVAKKNRLWH